MNRLILIRHGETDFTSQRKYCGHKKIPLNAKGVKQAEDLRHEVKKLNIDKIYTSDLVRTFQMSCILFKRRRLIKRRNLREIDFGKFSGLTFEESKKLYPNVYKIWMGNPMNVKIPGGETFRQFKRRVVTAFKKISRENSNKTIAIVAHGGPLRIILLHVLKMHISKFWDIVQDTAALNIIDFNKNKPKIIKMNWKAYEQNK